MHHRHACRSTLARLPGSATVLVLALALMPVPTASAGERLIALRFFDDNRLAQQAALPASAHAELEAAAGRTLVARGRDRDGAFLLAMPSVADDSDVRGVLNRLRVTGALVYAAAVPGEEAQRDDASEAPVRALIVRTRGAVKRDAVGALGARLAARLGVTRLSMHVVGGGAQRVDLPVPLDPARARELLASLAADADVEHVEVDRRARPASTPNDPLFASQWDLGGGPGGIGVAGAWAMTTGEPAAPVAVLDTGILAHPDLTGRVVAGYDMVASPDFAGDGDGRDADPSDPGDFVTAAQAADASSPLYLCAATASTWHGTMVAGTLGAVANNAVGLAGVNWRSPILDVRVMGKCGGALSDVADGIRWAAGLPVPGVPANPTPARVINLSMTGIGECGPILQAAVTEAVTAGSVVVAAAGNDNVDVAQRWPANCNGVISVGATSLDGSRAFYSNRGEQLSLSAPGGGIGGSIPVLRNTGSTTPDPAGPTYGQQVGTSLSAPLVSGTVSLMQVLAPTLTPAEVQAMLESTARAFPGVSADGCTPATCGAGLLSASDAVARAAGVDAPPPPEVAPVVPPQAPEQDEAPPMPAPMPGGWHAKDEETLEQVLKLRR
jgi:serine protease